MRKKKTARVRLDARGVVLLRETGCDRAHAMTAAMTDLEELGRRIEKDPFGGGRGARSAGPGAMAFGRGFETSLTAHEGRKLKPALTRLFAEDKQHGPAMKRGGFERVETFARIDESGSWNEDTKNIWQQTAELVRERGRRNEKGMLVFQGVLRLPYTADRFIVPDVMVSPPGCPWFVPFEIKSYERMGHLTEDQHVSSAAIQSSLSLDALMRGHDERGDAFPETASPRADLRTGIVFRAAGTYFPECMFVAAERDLAGLPGIFSRLPGDPTTFRERFGTDYDAVRGGDLDAIDAIPETFSDACGNGCRLADRCRGQLRITKSLVSYGRNFASAYPGYDRVRGIVDALRSAQRPVRDPDLAMMMAVEDEIDELLREEAR